MSTLPLIGRPSPPAGDTRDDRRERARRATSDVALELFAEHGFDATTVDQIAARAGISVATFFRYFPTKADAVFNDPERWLPDLGLAIVERPASEPDLIAVCKGLRLELAPRFDRDRASRQERAIASSPLLRGLSADVGGRWRAVISDALSRRHRLPLPDADTDLATELDRSFARVARLATAWSAPRADA